MASGTMIHRRVPVLLFVATLLIANRASAKSCVPVNQLSVPIRLISRAIGRRSTLTCSMSFHGNEMALRPVLDRHFPSS